jgi:hypothetical protein
MLYSAKHFRCVTRSLVKLGRHTDKLESIVQKAVVRSDFSAVGALNKSDNDLLFR